MNTVTGISVLKSVTATSEDLRIESNQQQTSEVKQQEAEQKEPLKTEELDDVVVELNDLAQNLQRDLQFSVDDKSGDTIIKVYDKQTEEIVREIPSAEIRAIKARLQDTAGVIFKDSV